MASERERNTIELGEVRGAVAKRRENSEVQGQKEVSRRGTISR